jgi:hypothetical protein
MMRLKRDPRFKEKFPELAEAQQEEEEERPWRVRLKTGSQQQE